MRYVLLALVLLAGCPRKPPAAPGSNLESGAPPEPMGSAPDTDEDGVSDHLDECPHVPGTVNGCPSASLPNDRDADGIPDGADNCPDDPEDMDGFSDQDGCPEPDNDQDGVFDARDKCPNEPEDKDAFTDDDGCPDPDNDGDGILDARDSCPNQAETKNGVLDQDGCPDAVPENLRAPPRPPPPPPPPPKPKKPADRDKDGFPDAQDRCPDEPESVNGRNDGDGCPD